MANNFMELEGLIGQIPDGHIYADAWALLDVLIGSILDWGDDIFDFHIFLAHAYLAADESLEVLDCYKFIVDFYVVGCRVASYVEENTHISLHESISMQLS